MRSEVIAVTPELAAEWLGRNAPENRSISKRRVRAWVGEMRAGRWELTHQGIAFSAAGVLVDGQHRLTAVVESGVTVNMLVFFDVPTTYSGPIDQGFVRTTATITGRSNSYIAMVRHLHRLQFRVPGLEALPLGRVQQMILEYETDLSAVWESVGQVKGYVTGPVLAALAFAHPVDPQMVLQFGTQVRYGDRLERNSPAYSFRQWMVSGGANNRETWPTLMATLNAARHHLAGAPLARIFTGESGYRAFCSRRRSMGIHPTPGTDRAPTMSFNAVSEMN